MFCRHCGKEIPDNAVFCVHCGVPTSDLASGGGVRASVPADPVHKGFPVAALIAVILSVLAFFGAMFAFSMWVAIVNSGDFTNLLLLWLLIFLFALVGVIFGIVGIARCKKNRLMGLSVAGLILGLLVFFLSLIPLMVCVFLYSVIATV